MYVLKKTDQNRGYVALPGYHESYTNKVRLIQTFSSKKEAEIHACENEISIHIDELFNHPSY